MTPLDDHLRTTLHDRADTLMPSSDPLGGIEAKARGMRRRKVAATVAGAALAVSAVAIGVPALRGGSTTPTTRVAASAEALDPAHPWAYRGPALPVDVLAGFRAGWSAVHPGSTLTPLFGDRYEVSGRWELVFVAGDRYGFIDGPPDATNLLVDEPLPADPKALVLAVPGDEVPRLLVVAAPDSKAVELTTDGVTYRRIEAATQCFQNDSALTLLPCPGGVHHPGTGLAPLEGTTSRVRVTGGDGTVVYDEAAPTLARASSPDNLLTWPSRGSQDSSLLEPARAALAPSLNADPSQVLLYVLFTGEKDGVRFVMGQAFKRGEATAHSFSYTSAGSTFFGPVTPRDPQVLAFLVEGTPSDVLVVVPAPRTSQVLYDDNPTGSFRPVGDTPGADGVGLIARSRTTSTDRLQLLTGNGDPATDVTFEGPVAPLLCGAKSCG